MREKIKRMKDVVENYSILLILGTVLALLWANNAPVNYHYFHNIVIFDNFFIGEIRSAADGTTHRVLTLHYLINDIGMALFFAIAGKEIWEAVALPGGSLKGKKAYVPLIATIGGMLGPVLVYLVGAHLFGDGVYDQVANGWAVPTATDIAFSLLVARLIFGPTHPAVAFLLLLAIADDAGGLVILAVFYPDGEVQPLWLLVSLMAALLAYFVPRMLGMVMNKRYSTFVRALPYIIAGCVSWYAFMMAGIHPALGLLPIIPAIPHAANDTYVFDSHDDEKKDMLNILEHNLKGFVQWILFFFGLMNAGVEFSAVGPATWLVLGGLVLGKPLGIFITGVIGAKVLGLGLPEGMSYRDLFTVGMVAAIGFTVALFVASVAFPVGAVQDAAKMGAVFSFGSAFLAWLAARLLKVRKLQE